jgi:hypothetical protein
MNPPSFAQDIHPLFTDEDVEHMNAYVGLDLSDYQQVKDHSDRILERVKGEGGERMPPSPRPAWDAAQIQLFQDWIDAGCQP